MREYTPAFEEFWKASGQPYVLKAALWLAWRTGREKLYGQMAEMRCAFERVTRVVERRVG